MSAEWLSSQIRIILRMISIFIALVIYSGIWNNLFINITDERCRKINGPGGVFKWIFYVIWLLAHAVGLTRLLIWAWT
jgi:hypothetical protein